MDIRRGITVGTEAEPRARATRKAWAWGTWASGPTVTPDSVADAATGPGSSVVNTNHRYRISKNNKFHAHSIILLYML